MVHEQIEKERGLTKAAAEVERSMRDCQDVQQCGSRSSTIGPEVHHSSRGFTEAVFQYSACYLDKAPSEVFAALVQPKLILIQTTITKQLN